MDSFNFDALKISSLEQTLFNKRCYPEDDCLKIPAVQALEQRRMLQEAEEGLQSHKTGVKMKMEALALRRDELNKKTGQLKESLKKFDKFLKDNEAKKLRALKKAVDERKSRDKKELELQQLSQEAAELEQDKINQIKTLKKNYAFQHYLENVIESGANFMELKDIINRHETLAATNEELSAKTISVQEATESLRKGFEVRVEEGNNRILNCNNEIARLQDHLEDLKSKTAQEQQNYDAVVSRQLQKSLQTNQVIQAIANLFTMVKSHVGQRVVPSSDPMMQLDRLQVFMVDVENVVQYMQRGQALLNKQNQHAAINGQAEDLKKSEFKQSKLRVVRIPVSSSAMGKSNGSANSTHSSNSSLLSSAHTSHYAKFSSAYKPGYSKLD